MFFGICAPIGSLKKDVIVTLENILKEKFGYDVEVLKMTTYIEKYKENQFKQIQSKTEAFSKLMYKINEGNAIRKKIFKQLCTHRTSNKRYSYF